MIMEEIETFEDIKIPTEVVEVGEGNSLTIASKKPLNLGSFKTILDPKRGKYLVRIADHRQRMRESAQGYYLKRWVMEGLGQEIWENDGVLVGKLNDGSVEEVKKKPRRASKVGDSVEDVFDFKEPYFGTLAGDGVKVGVHKNAFQQHMAILGRTGKGKTNSASVILAQLHGLNTGIPIVTESTWSLIGNLVEKYYSKGDNNNFVVLSTSDWNRDKCEELGIGDRVKKLTIDPNELSPKAVKIVGHVKRKSGYGTVIGNTFQNTKDKSQWFDNLREKVEDDELHEKTRDALERTIDQVLRSNWIEDGGLELYSFLNECIKERKAVLIDLQESGGALRPIGVLLAEKLEDICKKRMKRGDADIPVVLALDEAHQWLDKDRKDTVSTFIRTIKLVRQFGLGMMFITQQASNMDSRFFDQVGGLTICHGLGSGKEAKPVRKHFTNEVDKGELVGLNTGTGMYESDMDEAIGTAMRVKVFGPFKEVVHKKMYECDACGRDVSLLDLSYNKTYSTGKKVCKGCIREDIEVFM